MQYIDGDDAPAMAGLGFLADVHEGVDGNLYEWVEGLSAWGEPVGFWQGLAEVPVDTSMSGLGALYQASDGNLYQMHGLEADKDDDDEDEDGKEGTMGPKFGPGKRGEIRTGPEGRKYRWVLGLGPGGKRTGFWRRLHPRAAAARGGAPPPRARGAAPGRRPGVGEPPPAPPRKKKKPFLKKLLPFAKFATSFIPGIGPAVRAGLTVADKLLTKKQPGVAGDDNLGALYMASDGSLYQVHGIDEDELHGLYDGARIEGLAADDDLRGFAADDQLVGIDEFGDTCGCGHAHIHGVGRDEALDGYVRDVPSPGLRAYVPERAPHTRMFEPNRALPDNWKPLW